MTGWRKICCATDFSETSRAAFDSAVELACKHEAELLIVHVYHPPSSIVAGVTVESADSLRELTNQLETELERLRHQAEQRGVKAKARLDIGVPSFEIVRAAEAADLLIVGTHGRTGLSRALIGSVAERVVRHAACPVLVVRPRAG